MGIWDLFLSLSSWRSNFLETACEEAGLGDDVHHTDPPQAAESRLAYGSSGIFSENAVGWQLEDATDAMCENL